MSSSLPPEPYKPIDTEDVDVVASVVADLGGSRRPRWWTTLAVVFASLVIFILASTVMTFVAFAIVHGKFTTEMFT